MRTTRAKRIDPRGAVIFLATWLSLLFGVASLAIFFFYLPDIALAALALACCALSLSIRCYGMLTAKTPVRAKR